MIFEDNDRVRITPAELNLLRQHNAQNGLVVNTIHTRDELLAAVIGGLSPEQVSELLSYLERNPPEG